MAHAHWALSNKPFPVSRLVLNRTGLARGAGRTPRFDAWALKMPLATRSPLVTFFEARPSPACISGQPARTNDPIRPKPDANSTAFAKVVQSPHVYRLSALQAPILGYA
jgi:hypothetical protein